jgi:hypothetical protein
MHLVYIYIYVVMYVINICVYVGMYFKRRNFFLLVKYLPFRRMIQRNLADFIMYVCVYVCMYIMYAFSVMQLCM